ncbi:hypothetical protein BKA93DRAFT_800850 [Sparassis latifolia]
MVSQEIFTGSSPASDFKLSASSWYNHFLLLGGSSDLFCSFPPSSLPSFSTRTMLSTSQSYDEDGDHAGAALPRAVPQALPQSRQESLWDKYMTAKPQILKKEQATKKQQDPYSHKMSAGPGLSTASSAAGPAPSTSNDYRVWYPPNSTGDSETDVVADPHSPNTSSD